MNGRIGWVLILGATLLPGCMASKEAKSAGAVGCAPSEIEIGDEQHHGFIGTTADTWTATCRGRTFVCTQVNDSTLGESNEGGLASLLATNTNGEQVTCREEAETPQEEENREARKLARVQQALTPKAPQAAAPTGAGGFDFGISPVEAQRRCEVAGRTWTTSQPEIGNCSGTAAPIGVPARASVRFCAERACAIAIEHRPDTGWSSEVVALKGKLEAKYGASEATTRGIPVACRGEEEFKRCVESRQLQLGYSWRWPGGETVNMSVGAATANAKPSIRLVYVDSSSRVDASAL